MGDLVSCAALHCDVDTRYVMCALGYCQARARLAWRHQRLTHLLALRHLGQLRSAQVRVLIPRFLILIVLIAFAERAGAAARAPCNFLLMRALARAPCPSGRSPNGFTRALQANEFKRTHTCGKRTPRLRLVHISCMRLLLFSLAAGLYSNRLCACCRPFEREGPGVRVRLQ